MTFFRVNSCAYAYAYAYYAYACAYACPFSRETRSGVAQYRIAKSSEGATKRRRQRASSTGSNMLARLELGKLNAGGSGSDDSIYSAQQESVRRGSTEGVVETQVGEAGVLLRDEARGGAASTLRANVSRRER